MVDDVNNIDEKSQLVEKYFSHIDSVKADFNDIGKVDPDIKESFEHACALIENYKSNLAECESAYAEAKSDETKLAEFQENIPKLYKENIKPKMEEATSEMDVLVQKQNDRTTQIFFTTAKSVLIVIALLIFILVIGMVAIKKMQNVARNAAVKLQKRSDEVDRASKKLDQSRSKTRAMAFTNILTGMKNRYALEEDLSSRLQSDNFSIANFDFDHFRNFCEMYGRDFGDSFLSVIAERLKNDFAGSAEIYNIGNDEFTFLFDCGLGVAQINDLTQKIADTMSSYYTISNVTAQLSVSGCLYHFSAGDYTTAGSLISKLDSTMRVAKNNGGNTILNAN